MAHFSFRTLLNNETYGTGFFEYPDSLGTESGTTVYQDSITAFAYSDPDVGNFDLSNLNNFHFTIATTPTTCAFNIIMSTADRLKSVTAGPAQPGLLGPTSGKPIKLEWPSQAQATPVPAPAPTPAPTPTPTPAPLGMFLIRSRLNGFVIDITGSNTAPCTQLISYPVNGEKGTTNQHWHLLPTVGGASLIQSELNNFVIDITGSNTAPVTPVISYPANSAEGTSNQQWELIPVPGLENVYLIRSKLNGFVLDIEGGNPSPCARIISYPMNGEIGTPNQHWELVSVDAIEPPAPTPAPEPTPAPAPTPTPAPLGMFLIRSRLNGFVIDITGSNTAPCTQLISYPVNGEKGTTNQHWHLLPTVGGASLIQSELNNFVIDITGSNTAPVTPVISYPANSAEGTSNQQWELIPVPGLENVYLIRSKLNGFVLDIEGGNPSPCARIISYPMNGEIGTPNQHWELVSVDVIEPPAPTPAPEPTPAPAPEPAPAPLPTPVDPDIIITAIADVYMSNLVYKGQVKRTQSDEYVELTNRGNKAADISNWKVTSAGSTKQWFVFPAGSILDAGKSCRVYTNEVHPETGGFSFGSKTAIWNDAGDELNLFDATAKKVATLAYGKARKK